MAVLYMLDTSIASAVIRHQVDLDARLGQLSRNDWCISVVTRAELNFGVMRRPGATKLARLVAGFLDVARCLPFDEAAADEFARLRASLESQGTGIGMADEMIAAHALSVGAAVVTDNLRHFERVQRLQVENWLRPG
jgi:tRNA(fMet)-specific endonuclease VapC